MAKWPKTITWKEYKDAVESLGVGDTDKVCFINFDAEDFADGCHIDVLRNDDASVQITLEED